VDEKEILQREIAENVFGWTGLGWYGPPAEGDWHHTASVLFATYEEAREAYKTRFPDREDYGGSYMCRWKEGWGPLMLPEWADYTADALQLLELTTSAWNIIRCGGDYTVVVSVPSGIYNFDSNNLCTAICNVVLKSGVKIEEWIAGD